MPEKSKTGNSRLFSAFTSWQRWLFGSACLLLLRRFHWPPVILLGIGAIAGYAGLLP
jgi:hypothetical protein